MTEQALKLRFEQWFKEYQPQSEDAPGFSLADLFQAFKAGTEQLFCDSSPYEAAE